MDKLKFIKEQMEAAGIPYEFGEWSSPVVYPYSVGEITEDPIETEDGAEQSTLILTVFHRGKFIALEEFKQKVKRLFPPVYGLRGQTEGGGAIAVFFDGSFPVPSGEAELRKVQINIKIKEWKGAI